MVRTAGKSRQRQLGEYGDQNMVTRKIWQRELVRIKRKACRRWQVMVRKTGKEMDEHGENKL